MSTAPANSFSSSGEDVITKPIDVIADTTADDLTSLEFDQFYEISRTAQEIVRGDYQRVALQFPDELLHHSVPIFRRLKKEISTLTSNSNIELYVLADTSYGSCCVDEVAAQHANADLVVHYGHACMTLTSRLPVVYVFGQKKLRAEHCANQLLTSFESNRAQGGRVPEAILLKHDVRYTHVAESILDNLQRLFSQITPPIPVFYHKMPLMTYPSSDITGKTSPETLNITDEASHIDTENMAMLFVGGESLGLTNLLITNSARDIYTYDPASQKAKLESGRTNKLLMRRYVAVQKARDADVFGILIGTLGVASYLPLITHIRQLLARKHKKSYTISVGKLNPSKLANFMEVECFVLIACPENSLIDDKEFLRPIVTPYELEAAMQLEQSWSGHYVLDFESLLANKDIPSQETTSGNTEGEKETDSQDNDDPDQPVFSLVTGTYRQAKRYGDRDSASEQKTLGGLSALVLRNQDDQVARMSDSAAAQFLQQRTYQGLEMRLDEDAPSVLEQGRSGIARGYQST